MSWNIYIYAEVKHKDSDEYVGLTNSSLFDNYKDYKDSFYDDISTMSAADSSHPQVRSLTDYCGNPFTVGYCSLDEFTAHYNKVIDSSIEKIKVIYKALGLFLSEECGYLYCVSDDDDDSKSSKLTFPVNKELLDDLATILNDLNRANTMMGFCNVVESMCSFDDKVRLIFAVF